MIIAYNDDLLTAIFIWLPPKSLIKFKSVCKHWFSLISSDHFSHQHRRHEARPSLLLRLKGKPDHFYLNLNPRVGKNLVPYDFPSSLVEPAVSGFSNGLFLLRCPAINTQIEECHVYNPTTRRSRRVALDVDARYRTIAGLNLAFDPSESPHYEIVCVRSTGGRPRGLFRGPWRFYRIEVYESENMSWSIRGEPFWAPTDVHFDRGVYLSGCVHWRGMFFRSRDGLVGEHPKIAILDGTGRESVREEYVGSRGYLHCIAHLPERNSVMVFELESDHSDWSLKFRIDLGRVPGFVSMLGVVRGEGEEGSMVVVHERAKVVGYEFNEEGARELVDLEDEAFYEEGCVHFGSNCVFQFVETLAQP